MIRKHESEMTKDMRILLNAGHGPPDELLATGRPLTNGINDLRPPRITTTTSNANLDLPTSSVDPSSEIIKKLQSDLRQKGEGLNILGQMLREKTQANNELKEQVNDLKKQLDSKSEKECDGDRKYKQLVTMLTTLPDVSVNDEEKLVGAAAREPTREANGGAHKWDSDEDLSTSIACSEDLHAGDDLPGSTEVHRVIPEVCTAVAAVHTSGNAAEAPRKSSSPSPSSSSSSFEIVTHENCVATTTEKQDDHRPSDMSGRPVQNETLTEQVSDQAAKILVEDHLDQSFELQELRTDVDGLKRAIESETRERIKEHLQLKSQMMRTTNSNEMKMNDLQMRRKMEELELANWKLEKEKLELMREHETLKYRERSQELPSEGSDMLQIELQTLRDEVEQLIAEKSLNAADAKSRISELEQALLQSESALNNSTTYESLSDENAVLKHQIEAYKDDFEVERKDREKLVSQKDTLQRSFEVIHSELLNARQQLKKHEDDICLLRIDNDRLKTRLREVSDELASSKKTQANTFSSQVHAKTDIEWECKICTFRNPMPRSSCEMCGAFEVSRQQQQQQGQLPPPSQHPIQWNIAPTTSRHPPSNGLNYVDLDID